MKTYVLGIPIDVVNFAEALARVKSFLEEDKKNRTIITPNPEVIMMAKKDSELFSIIEKADLVVPDGEGVVLASKDLKEKVAGCDLVIKLLETATEQTTLYLLGAKPDVVVLAAKNIEQKYKNVSVVGYHSGYFDLDQEKKITEEISLLKPHILLVGLGTPKQEKWIAKHKNLPVNVSIGVGGTIDVLAGAVKRAPKIFIKLKLEWFYRLIRQPRRITRMAKTLPVFVVKVIFTKIF